jgi:hypothetical protein
MNSTELKAFKELERVAPKYKQQGAVWTYSIAKKMIEDAVYYDVDVIEVMKELVSSMEAK